MWANLWSIILCGIGTVSPNELPQSKYSPTVDISYFSPTIVDFIERLYFRKTREKRSWLSIPKRIALWFGYLSCRKGTNGLSTLRIDSSSPLSHVSFMVLKETRSVFARLDFAIVRQYSWSRKSPSSFWEQKCQSLKYRFWVCSMERTFHLVEWNCINSMYPIGLQKRFLLEVTTQRLLLEFKLNYELLVG
jgi:hypothetical protein